MSKDPCAAAHALASSEGVISSRKSRLLVRVCAALVLIASGIGARDLNAIAGTPLSTPKSCGYQGGSGCPDPAVIIGPWIWLPGNPFYPIASDPQPFYSAADVISWFLPRLINPNSVYCSATETGVTYSEPGYSDGILWSQDFYMNFSAVVSTTATPACANNTTTFESGSMVRQVYCPVEYTQTYTASPVVGPYCAPPTAAVIPVKQVCLTCGGTVKGDGVDASNGNKIETAIDYGGVGTNPIPFVRTYSSLAAEQIMNGPGNMPQPVGLGWQATYFQYLLPVSVTDSRTTYNTVYAFRPDGSTLIFNELNGTYSPDGDVRDSLVPVSGGGWQYQTANDTIETYNATGQLTSIALRGQSPLTLTYASGSGLGDGPLSVADAFGHSLTFGYLENSDSIRSLGSITDSAGHTVQYAYDSYGNLTSVTNADGTTQGYTYGFGPGQVNGNVHMLMTLTDEASVAYKNWTYGGTGYQPTGSQRAGGVDSYTFSGTSSISVTDPLGTAYTYSQSLILGVYHPTSASSYCSGCPDNAARTYDGDGNVATRTDFNGHETTYSYDELTNRETSRTEAYGTSVARTITTKWDASWQQPDLITEPNRTTAYTYNSLGDTLTKTVTDTTVTPNVTRVWTYTYDSYGRMLTAKGPRTDVNSTTTYTYYTCTTGSQCGELETVTDPVGNVTTYNTYNAYGQPLTITDPNGVVTTLTYDARQRLLSRQVSTETTSFSYYPTGLLKQVTLPDSSYVLYTYDPAHRLTEISDGAGNSIQYTLDAMGNRTATKTYDPSNNRHLTHTRVINTLNELYQDVNAANTSAVTTTYGYDSNGNQNSIAAPLSRNTANVYDPLNRLSQITDPNSGNTYFGYDSEDDLTSVKDPRSLTTTYGYNGFGDVKSLASPDTGSSSNTYDSGGNLSVATDARGSTANYSYDAANRMTQTVYKNSAGVTDQTIVFGYDAGTDGKTRLTSASDANHSLAFTYDFMGRVTGKSLTVGSTFNKSVGYGYTNADLTALVTPSGQSVVYGYNSNHQITSVKVNGTSVISSVTYEPFGGVNGWTWGDGTTVSRTFNGDGLISQVVTAATTHAYTFDNANRITGISDSSNSALTWTYGYDLLDRLNSATTSAITDGWTYDANGNRLTQTGTTAITFSVSSTDNQLTSTTGGLVRTYTYDAAGNTTSNGPYGFSYNNRGRMASTGAGSTNYLYSALGQLIEKSNSSATTVYMYDEAGHTLGEYSGSGTLIQETLWLGDIPVATLRPNGSAITIYYVHTDHLNSPRKVAQPSTGTLAWRWDSDPFGTAATNQNPAGLGTFVYDLRFPGQTYMAETGLNQNVNRDYDPAVGRYVESDPIGLIGGVNTFAYTGNSPVDLSDSHGLVGYDPPDAPEAYSGWPICDGHGGITIQFPTDPKVLECMKDCVSVHEAVHIVDLRHLTPSVCANQKYKVIPKFDTPEQAKASEVSAYKAELRCLIKKLQGLGADCHNCRQFIEYEINTDVPNAIKQYSRPSAP